MKSTVLSSRSGTTKSFNDQVVILNRERLVGEKMKQRNTAYPDSTNGFVDDEAFSCSAIHANDAALVTDSNPAIFSPINNQSLCPQKVKR